MDFNKLIACISRLNELNNDEKFNQQVQTKAEQFTKEVKEKVDTATLVNDCCKVLGF